MQMVWLSSHWSEPWATLMQINALAYGEGSFDDVRMCLGLLVCSDMISQSGSYPHLSLSVSCNTALRCCQSCIIKMFLLLHRSSCGAGLQGSTHLSTHNHVMRVSVSENDNTAKQIIVVIPYFARINHLGNSKRVTVSLVLLLWFPPPSKNICGR